MECCIYLDLYLFGQIFPGVGYRLNENLQAYLQGSQASSAFRLVLLTVFINDFDEDLFIKLAVDSRLGGTASMIGDLIWSQENLDHLKCHVKNNRVKKSKDKYNVFKIGFKK